MKIFSNEINPNILCTSEHSGDDTKLESLQISGYKLMSQYCLKKNNHSGTAIFAEYHLDICT